MATVTPNFNWPVPTSTDLVKDGATAMEALGDAIDTSMVDLKGGTTGQVLAKASNTDMDFSWVAQDDSNAIQNTIVDAKGDLIAASAADTPARLAVGSNGETLVADSSTSTGLRYTAGTVQANPVLNSAMAIFQRGTSVAVTTGTSNNYTADRWALSVGANQASTVSRQATGDTTNLPFIQYCARVQRNSGQTGTGAMNFDQSIETINSIPFVGKTVTVSFYARAGANYSPTSSVLTMQLVTGTGTDQNISTATGVAVAGSTNATLTTTWQRFTFTVSIGTSVTQLFLRSANTPTGTAGTNDWYELTGVQIDIGSVALPFRTYAGTIQGETSACQRYYYRTTATQAYSDFGSGYNKSANEASYMIPFPVTMRTTPTSLEQTGTASNYNILHQSGGSPARAVCSSVPTYQVATPTMARVDFLATGALSAGQGSIGGANNSTIAYLGWSAEL